MEQFEICFVLSLLPANGWALEMMDKILPLCKDIWLSNLANPPTVRLKHGSRGKTRLMHACRIGDISRVKWLVEQGSDVNAICDLSWPWHLATPLQFAAGAGHYEVCCALLDFGAKVDLSRDDGYTALHAAAKQGFVSIVSLLLSHGANPNSKLLADGFTGGTGVTPLILAGERGHFEVVQVLLNGGADVNIVNEQDGTTPLIAAASTVHVKGSSGALLEIVRAFLQRGAQVNSVRWFDGLTALLGACECGRTSIVRELLEAGAMLSPHSETCRHKYGGKTPLMAAAQRGAVDIATILIEEAGAEVNEEQPISGKSALGWACERGNTEVVELLLARFNANPNQLAKYGWTPLMFAARMCHPACVEVLLFHGAEKDILNTDGESAKDIASSHGHRAVRKLL